MALSLGVLKESGPNEKRVALVPEGASRLARRGLEILIERASGEAAGYRDEDFAAAGAKLVPDRSEILSRADILSRITPPSPEDAAGLKRGSILVSFIYAARNPELPGKLRQAGASAFAMELVPRISRAQAMDALSSQATAAGYKAALMAAELCPRFWPMITTAFGTIRPARVLVCGAGVAGLMAISVAKRLGALVEAYDVRKAAGEEVKSLGAKFLEIGADAESAGGYARELTDAEKAAQAKLLAEAVARADAVITTANLPGRRAPLIVTRGMLEAMKPGSVLIDGAAESGGNCELSKPGETIEHKGVTIAGPLNLPSLVPFHASQMYSKNIEAFLDLLVAKDGRIVSDLTDEILSASAVVLPAETAHA